MYDYNIPAPIPLPESGKYSELPKPQWKLKTPPPLSFKVSYGAHFPVNPSTLIYSFPQPDSTSEMPSFLQSLISSSIETPKKNPSSLFHFNSYIECGNLESVFQKSSAEFDLLMKTDTNSKGHSQWFYFEVKNDIIGCIKINILNFSKGSSLFQRGMKPLSFSTYENEWREIKNAQYHRYESESGKKYYMLSFTFQFEHYNDKVTFAFSRPYTFSRLQNFIAQTEQKLGIVEDVPIRIDKNKLHYRRELLCNSLGGLPLYALTITADKHSGIPFYKRKGAVITARVHAGETTGSFVMESIISFLLDNSKQAIALRNVYIFKIIPMLNPDGVVCGNYRTSLSGDDLNRQWINPNMELHPCIYHTKMMMKKLAAKREVTIFCDLHAHAKKKNSFIYGCNTAADGGFASWTKVRLFPRVLAKVTPLFSYKDCRFSVSADKMGTGRVVVWKELRITNSFTLETSFYGYEHGEEIKPYDECELFKLGVSFGQGLLEYTYLLRNLEIELLHTHGWLKPSKMKEISGTPAQELLQKKLEEEKREVKMQEMKEKAKFAINSRRPSTKEGQQKLNKRKNSIKPKHEREISENEWNQVFDEFPIDTSLSKYFSLEEIERAQKNEGLEDEGSNDTSGSDSGDSESESASIYSRNSSICLIEDEPFKFKIPIPQNPIYLQDEPSQLKSFVSASDIGACFTTFTYFQTSISPKIINSTSFENFNNKTYRSRFFKPFMSASRSRTHIERKNEIETRKRSISTSRNGNLGPNFIVDCNKSAVAKLQSLPDRNIRTVVKHLSRPKANRTLHFAKETTNQVLPNFCVKSVKMPVRPVIMKRSSNKQL
ncbi:unnamed protein product [Blepharisma stoltei]|uniref:Peptidase M14 domain-containing protein n=1 Tax=Blepharisma stoltei TaxID=1481888 RepID=A0AAU9IZ30_9CILI|nr:unnamed protein product [Blepharisma stoltei]